MDFEFFVIEPEFLSRVHEILLVILIVLLITVVEQTERATEQHAVLAPTQLARHDDSSVRPARRLPLRMERSKVANIEREDGPAFTRRERKLLVVRGGRR
jgi:hypothetical protein